MSFVKPRCHDFRDISKDKRDKLIKLFDDAYCSLENIYIEIDPCHSVFKKKLTRAMDAVALVAADFEDSKFEDEDG